MKVYFVRHGEGIHNRDELYSKPDFELTEKGIQQAQSASERFKNIKIDKLIVSPFKRTVQTAEIINKVVNKEITYSDLAVEVRRPSEIAGKPMKHPEIQKIRDLMDANLEDESFHYSDEENFFDLRNRALKFINYLEGFSEDNLLVVTHSVFIKMVVLSMMLGKNLAPRVFEKAYWFLHLETSGLTLCEFDNKDGWSLTTWNDHAHLG